MMMIDLIALVILLLLSAFFSGSETAIIAARRMKLEVWIRQKKRYANRTLGTMQNPQSFLITTLVGNNIAIVACSTLLAIYLSKFMDGLYITLISTAVLLLFGEILPKSIAIDKATSMALRSTVLMRVFYFLFYPVIRIIHLVIHYFFQRLHLNFEQKQKLYTRKDIEFLVLEGRYQGQIKTDHLEMISRFILHGEFSIRDIMIPRMHITAVRKDISLEHLIRIFEKTGFSRLPVYDESLDHIVGIYVAKDILLRPSVKKGVSIRKALFVPEAISITALLNKIRESGDHLAVVIDEYGGTAGLITLEDIIESFFGDIQDEFDEDITLYRKVTPLQIDVHARVEVTELNTKFGLDLPTGNYQTAAGLLMQTVGYIPRRGEKFQFNMCTITVMSCTRKQLLWIRINKSNV